MVMLQGHTVEEQYDLASQCEALVDEAIAQTIDQWLVGVGMVAAAAPLDGEGSFQAIWNNHVDGTLAPFIHGVYSSSALGMAAGIANNSDLPPGIGIPGVPDAYTADFVAKQANQMKGIADDVWGQISNQLQEGVKNNEGIPELTNRVRRAGALATPRAQNTARTTVVAASNAGSFALASLVADDSSMRKMWVATEDIRTRIDHVHADGQTVALTAKFTVGGWSMDHPGDPTAPAEEVVNCRCTLVYSFTGQPSAVCECDPTSQDVASLSAAGQIYTPSTITTSSCTCPTTESLGPSPHAAEIKALPAASKNGMFATFQGPQKISPAYGGAKIHKQLQVVMQSYGYDQADIPALLDVMDQRYALAGGKTSFKTKYEDWLNSPAGKKAVPEATGGPAPTPAATPKAISTPTPAFTEPRGLPVIPQPKMSNLKQIGGAGGSHGAKILQDVNGEKWIFKPVPPGDKDYVAKLEVAAAKLQSRVGLRQPSVYVVNYNGKLGSLQSMHAAKDAWPSGGYDLSVSDALKLSEQDIIDLQREQIFDWLIGNGDSHPGNFLRGDDGHLIGIDKGQAFKFYSSDKLNWTWKPPGNFGTPVYNTMWKAFAEGKNITLFDPHTGVLKDLIDQIMSVPDDQIKAYLRPYAEQALSSGKLAYGDIDKFMDAVVARKNSIGKDFDALYQKALAERAKHIKSAAPPPPSSPLPPTTVQPLSSTSGAIAQDVMAAYNGYPTAIVQSALGSVKYKMKSGASLEEALDDVQKLFASQTKASAVKDLGLDPLFPDIVNVQSKLSDFQNLDGTSVHVTWKKPSAGGAPPAPPPASIVTQVAPTAPTVVDLTDISAVPGVDMTKVYAAFKNVKPVTPNWGGAAVYKTLQEARKTLGPDFDKYNDAQLLKMLDKTGPSSAKKYYDVVNDWLQTPQGKSYVAKNGLPDLAKSPTPSATVPTPTPTPATANVVVGQTPPDEAMQIWMGSDDLSKYSSSEMVDFVNDFNEAIVSQNAPSGSVDLLKVIDDVQQKQFFLVGDIPSPLQIVKAYDHIAANNHYWENQLKGLLNTPEAQNKIFPGIAQMTTKSINQMKATDWDVLLGTKDISSVPQIAKDALHNYFIGSPIPFDNDPWAKIQDLQAWYNSFAGAGDKISPWQVIKILDEYGGTSWMPAPYTEKFLKFFKTTEGKKQILGLGKVAPTTTTSVTDILGTDDISKLIQSSKNTIWQEWVKQSKTLMNNLLYLKEDNVWDVVSMTLKSLKKNTGIDITPLQLTQIADSFNGGLDATTKLLTYSKTTKGEAEILKSQAAAATTTTPSSTAATVLAANGDITSVSDSVKSFIVFELKNSGINKSTPVDDVWDALQKIHKIGDPSISSLNDLQIARILDESNAIKLGKPNTHIYEDKLVKWLQTPQGKSYVTNPQAAKAAKAAKAAQQAAAKAQTTSSSSSMVSWSYNDLPTLARQIEAYTGNPSDYRVLSLTDASGLKRRMLNNDPWTPEAQSALRDYTGSGSSWMNPVLRGYHKPHMGVNINKYGDVAKHAQSGMRPSPDNIIVHRGTGADAFGLPSYGYQFSDFQKLIGQEVQDKGFVSTSVGGKEAFSGRISLTIYCPRGTQMAYVKPISQHKGENEMLLAAGTKFKILDVKQSPYGGIEVYMVVIG